jgi:hypothetical protein
VKFLRWFILGATLFFLIRAFEKHWQDIVAINFSSAQIVFGFIALLLTFMAHVWSGIVWAGILRFLQQPAPLFWVLPVYLQTNLAKYLPGNVWHFYGRIRAVQAAGSTFDAATLTTLLEPLLMATAAVLITLGTLPGGWLISVENDWYQWLPWLFAGSILMMIHPSFFNRILKLVGRLKKQSSPEKALNIERYPWFPLLGEIGFVSLRGSGFIVTLAGFAPLAIEDWTLILGAFSIAWFLGLVVPSPGGMGVFESSAIALLSSSFSPAILLSSLALFRLISLSAEVIAAGLSWGMKSATNN